ncbi:hypothetical protein CS0771_46840 [Catellatospora sp. IY07-71]|uniref:hypothetical protein n=1 Tax=Catellatospora sp. IY07-71 TaxID=2728827 RepID=UPI001BB3C73E|nr:hypothetical protein [Catellatospora sp. IY07-71]BCJ75140.1 hypothetical protein CS0771_46840 [Catellatospora sp. IY07-71]
MLHVVRAWGRCPCQDFAVGTRHGDVGVFDSCAGFPHHEQVKRSATWFEPARTVLGLTEVVGRHNAAAESAD